jgi:hypothetical protein
MPLLGCCLLLPFAIDIFHGSNAFLCLSLVEWLGTESERESERERASEREREEEKYENMMRGERSSPR